MDHARISQGFVSPVAALLVVSLGALAAVIAVRADRTDLREVKPILAHWVEDGDLILLVPGDRAADLGPLEEHGPAIAASALPDTLDRFRRVVVVRRAGDAAAAVHRQLERDARLLAVAAAGGHELELYQLDAPVRVVDDLDAIVSGATVSVVESGRTTPCVWTGARFDCGDADWTWVGPTTQSFAGEPSPCIWSHPVDDADLRIVFPRVRGDHLDGWYGLTDYAAAIPDGSAVHLDIEAGGTTARFRAHRQTGRRPLDVRLPPDFDGPVTLTISAPRAGVRHFCWSIQAVSPVAP